MSKTASADVPAAEQPVEDLWVDQVVPESIDWRHWVREYPIASVGAVAAVGFLVGRLQGDRIVGIARDAVGRQIDDSLARYTGFVSQRRDAGRDGDGRD